MVVGAASKRPSGANGNSNRAARGPLGSGAEELIPMSENRITEHDDSMSDF